MFLKYGVNLLSTSSYHSVEQRTETQIRSPYSPKSYNIYLDIVGFELVEMATSTNQKPTIYRNLYEDTGPETT